MQIFLNNKVAKLDIINGSGDINISNLADELSELYVIDYLQLRHPKYISDLTTVYEVTSESTDSIAEVTIFRYINHENETMIYISTDLGGKQNV